MSSVSLTGASGHLNTLRQGANFLFCQLVHLSAADALT
jgi:hypothetical protein